ncbi:imidazole glycerol phosphate synthase subunit HisH [Conexibacter sp. DBS9H8]|uniref:imidazole glycerol phosphate synthase subunit HisH n=1 Tax=Conexibacter sp. DBS9H8 TaxID=2937801 RepID=UPI00200BF8A0|nr:imidazole glycerol phosphate synthase subunit HisH [Conexibacter sp. DBS9H8]
MTAASGPVRVGIIDYGMGNRRSVEKALVHVGADVRVSDDTDELAGMDALVLPGVGAFARGMAQLRERGLIGLICDQAASGTPLLGICLGMQLLFEGSSELGGARGLGLLPGEVRALAAGRLPVPHIGWNEVTLVRSSQLLERNAPFYHVHSYCAVPADPADVIATAHYGERFATAVGRANVLGVQFHPEKSSTDGLALLRRFCEGARAEPTAARPGVGGVETDAAAPAPTREAA